MIVTDPCYWCHEITKEVTLVDVHFQIFEPFPINYSGPCQVGPP